MSTIKDVAKLANVSATTVSRVINNTAPVNEETRQRILKVMEDLHYSPNTMAQGMRTKRSKTIGVIIPDYSNSFYYHLFQHLESESRSEGYHLIISSIGYDTKPKDQIQYVNDLVGRNVDGLVVCSYQLHKELSKFLMQLSNRLAVVFMDYYDYDQSVNFVYTNGYRGIKTTTNHLIDLGHTNIGYISAVTQYKVAIDRYRGYSDTMNNANLPINEDLVYKGDYSIESGKKAGEYFYSLKNPPTAIVSCNDLMAVGAMQYFSAQGVTIPDDVAITGFDDIYVSELVTPSLTTYRQPIAEIAKETIHLFLQNVENLQSNKKQIILDGELVIRNSTVKHS